MEQYHEVLGKATRETGIAHQLSRFERRHLKNVRRGFEALMSYLLMPALGAKDLRGLKRKALTSQRNVSASLGAAGPSTWIRLMRGGGRQLLKSLHRQYHSRSAATRSRHRFTFVLDDWAQAKRSKRSRLVVSDYDGSVGKVRPCMKVVGLTAVIGKGKLSFPIDARLRLPRRQAAPGRPPLTQLELAAVMLRDLAEGAARNRIELRGCALGVDAWYTAEPLVRLARELGLVLVGKPKRNQKLDVHRLGCVSAGELLTRELPLSRSRKGAVIPHFRVKAHSSSLQQVALVIRRDKDEPRCAVSSEPTWDAPRILSAWDLRWTTESWSRSMKNDLNFSSCRFKDDVKLYAHLALRSLAYLLFNYVRSWIMKKRITMGQMLRDRAIHSKDWLSPLASSLAIHTPFSPVLVRQPR